VADKNDARELAQKFKVGQVVIWERSKGRRPMPFIVLEVEPGPGGEAFYQIDRKNCLAQHMLRPLTESECGESALTAYAAALTQQLEDEKAADVQINEMVKQYQETIAALTQERDALPDGFNRMIGESVQTITYEIVRILGLDPDAIPLEQIGSIGMLLIDKTNDFLEMRFPNKHRAAEESQTK
jgi:hypothetical protein